MLLILIFFQRNKSWIECTDNWLLHNIHKLSEEQVTVTEETVIVVNKNGAVEKKLPTQIRAKTKNGDSPLTSEYISVIVCSADFHDLIVTYTWFATLSLTSYQQPRFGYFKFSFVLKPLSSRVVGLALKLTVNEAGSFSLTVRFSSLFSTFASSNNSRVHLCLTTTTKLIANSVYFQVFIRSLRNHSTIFILSNIFLNTKTVLYG